MYPSGRRLAAVIVALGISLWTAVPPARGAAWRVTGRGGDAAWGETPLVIELKLPIPPGSYLLEVPGPGGPVAAVVFQRGDRGFLGTVLPRVPAREHFSYRMKGQPASEARAPDGIRILAHGPLVDTGYPPPSPRHPVPDRTRRGLVVTLDDHPWTEYRIDVGNKPFFFPLIGPTGEPYTRAYPMVKVAGEDHDHPHQRSCWFTHGSVNGVDFWGEAQTSGTIRELARWVVDGPVLGQLWTRNAWLAPGDRKVCEDERTVTFYRTKGSRIIDFEVVVHAGDGPVTFGDTKEGMFGLRVASSMDVDKKKGGKITNAQGLTDAKAWGHASSWVDYVGPVQGKTVGIAILNHPDSFRYPTTWHVRPYGLFAANPFGWHDFDRRSQRGDYTIPAGRSIRFAYRVILHEGDTASIGLPGLFQAYAQPPIRDVQAE